MYGGTTPNTYGQTQPVYNQPNYSQPQYNVNGNLHGKYNPNGTLNQQDETQMQIQAQITRP
jgi:hypothetical protein